MLNKELENILNKQTNMELWSGYLYLSMSYDMNHKGFSGISKWFETQAKEEFEHAQKIANHIIEMDGQVKLAPIDEVRQEWNSPKDAFEDTLMHEKLVTESIHKLYEHAINLKAYATVLMLEWFVTEQVEEEENPRKILGMIEKMNNHTAAMYMLDQQLGGANRSSK